MSSIRTSIGVNYRGSSVNQGSDLVGWDNGSIRSEVYSFTTGDWPITHLSWWGPRTSVYQGSNIAIRFVISTSPYVNHWSSSEGYALNKNTTNQLDVELLPHTTYYFSFFPGVSRNNFGLINIGDRPASSDNWFTLYTTEVTYTQCLAPTSLVLSRAIQTPGENVTLSWSGAQAGTNLTIGSYDVYRSTAVDGTYTLLGNTTNTSYTVAAPSAGNYYYYKVVTKPAEEVTGYDSNPSAASSGLKGNTAPGAPTVSVNRSIVPSYGGDIVFTVTPGTDNDGQTLTLAYATTSGGTKTAFTSPLTLNFTQASTIYFYTYDGLAYSSATSQAITVNVKPVISTATYNARTLYNALGGDGATGKQLGYASAITPQVNTTKTGTMTVELEWYESDNTTAWNSQTVHYSTLQNATISSSGTDVVLNNYNIHQFITLGSTNIHWRLRFKMNDGIEDSDFKYYPSDTDETYYAIARPSSLIDSYNQFSNSNIVGTTAGQVWRNVRLKVYNDTSVTVISATATISGSAISTTVATSTSGVYRYIDITLPDGLASEATINIVAQMKDSSNSITKSISASVTETKLPTVGDLSHGAPTIKPFTDTGTFEVATGWPFGSYTAIDATTLAAYNCSTTVSDAIKIIHSSSNSGGGANRVTKTPNWVKSGDNISGTLNKAYSYDWSNSLGITNYSGTFTYYCRLEITNLFGKVIATPWISRIFDFRELAQSPTITSIEWSLDQSSWTTLGANDKIQEGIYVRFNCSFGLYATDEVKVSMMLKNSSGERSVSCYEYGSPTKITPITYLSTELTRATNRTVATNTKSYVYHVTNEIADTTTRQWRLQIETSGGIKNSSYKDTAVTRQCAPTLILDLCSIDSNIFTYAYTLTDNGGGSLTNYLCDDGTKTNVTNALSGASGTAQATVTGWESKPISVKIVSVVTGLYTNTKTYYSNAIIVYQIAPTVAYRDNHLGINTKTPAAGAIIDIHPSTGRETIIIRGLDGSNPPKATKFEINPTTGEIKFYVDNTLRNTIDLLNGILT